MTSTEGTNGPDTGVYIDEMYTFKAFKYKELKPVRGCTGFVVGMNNNTVVPYPRSGHRIGADSANFYSFGGYNPLVPNSVETITDDYYVQSFPLFQELWKFNYASRQWTKYPNSRSLPLELASNALLLDGNCLMVYGGTGSPFGFRCSNQLYVFRVNDENGNMKEVQTSGQHPLPLYGQALIYHNDYLYTIGGTTGLTYTCDIHRLNMKTLQWEIVYICKGQGEYEPTGRYRHEVAFDGGNIYILGGGTAEDAYGFKHIPVFNLEKNEWVRKKSQKDPTKGIPAARRCHGAVQITGEQNAVQVFISGGHDGTNIFDDLWRLNLRTMQWQLIETCRLPHKTYFHSTAVSPEGKLYIFGGIYCKSGDVKRTNQIYTTWLCIPKLSELCWEAVLHYYPHINYTNRDYLINSGVPKRFVHRLNRIHK